MKINKLFYISFFFIINIFSVSAQSFPLKKDFLTYFVKDEITTHLNNLVDFEFDEYGRAWILLTNGLVLYDGNKYESIPFTQLSIPDYSFQEIIKNPSGGFYLLGYKNLEGKEGVKLNLKIIALNPLLKSWVPIEQEFKSFNKEVLDLTNLYSFDNNKIGSISKSGYFYIKNKYNWEKKFKIPNLYINTIFPAKNNQWHAYSTNIYYRLDEKGDILFGFKVKSPFIEDFIEFKENKDKCFLQLKDELIFIDENSMPKSEVSYTNDKSISLTNVLNLFIDSKGKYWLKYLNKVVVFDENGDLFQEFPEIKNIDLYWSGMFPIKEDNLGKIWIHLGDGFFINKQKQNDIAFYLKDKRYSFRGIQQINDSILYFNSYKGIYLLNLNSGEITKKISSKYNYLGAFYDEPRKKIFLGSNTLGFDVLNLESNKISEVKGNLKNGYHFIFLQKGLKNNYFWIGDFGFQRFDLQNEKLKEFISLPKDYISIHSFYEGNDFYLIGTDQGLLKYLPKYKKWIQLKNIPRIKVTGIAYAENKYFISTTGAGIILLDKNHNLINTDKYDLRGLNKTIFSMILDVDMGIWLGTENGLYYLNPRTIKHQYYSFLDGVYEKEFNWLSATNLKNGDIVMGTINGLVRFNPQKMIHTYDDFQNGRIFFSSLKINSFTNTQNRNGLNEYLSKGKITLNPNEYSITLNPGFTNNYIGKQPFFYVKMPNLEDWQLVRPFESITLNPKPGKSEITVRISSNNLNGEIKETKIPVFKLQHILENKTFLWFVSILFLLLIGIIFFLRYRLLTGKNKELERNLAIRVKDLELNEQSLIDKNNKLAILNEERRRFFDILGHEVNTPLAGMKQLSHTFNYLLKKGEYEKALKIAQSLEHSGTEISHLVDNLLTWSNLEKNTQLSRNLFFNITDKLNSTVDLFIFQIHRKNIQFKLSLSEGFDGEINSDPNIISFILRNILSNAIKYCPDYGDITCTLHRENNCISLSVYNSSEVLSADNFSTLIGFSPVSSLPGTFQEKGLGIGLFMVCQLILIIRGTITYDIHPNGGVTAIIKIKS